MKKPLQGVFSSFLVTLSSASAESSIAVESFSARRTGLHGPSFVDRNVLSVNFFAIEHFNGFLSFFFSRHFHKTKTLGTAGHFINNHGSRFNGPGLRKSLF